MTLQALVEGPAPYCLMPERPKYIVHYEDHSEHDKDFIRLSCIVILR